MKTINVFLVLILSGALLFSGCSDDDTSMPTDNLEQYEVLGEWKLEARLANNVTDLAVECCDYITFSSDDTREDLSGNLKAKGTGYETVGTFNLNPTESFIQISFDDEVLIYNYEINGNALSFTYEEDGDTIEELWRKQ